MSQKNSKCKLSSGLNEKKSKIYFNLLVNNTSYQFFNNLGWKLHQLKLFSRFTLLTCFVSSSIINIIEIKEKYFMVFDNLVLDFCPLKLFY